MPDFHGYPQHPDAHPERPWWRLANPWTDGGVWRRTDGQSTARFNVPSTYWGSPEQYHTHIMGIARQQDDYLARIDTTNPLPPPHPRCGQVWICDDNEERLVVAVQNGCPVFGGHPLGFALNWPPAGAVLVDGHGAPWAPMGGSDA